MKNKTDEFTRVESLAKFIGKRIGSLEPPYGNRRQFFDFLVKSGANLIESFQNLMGRDLYVKNENPNIDLIPARFHRMINRLHGDNILKNITYPEPIPDWPNIPAVALKFGRGTTASGCELDYDTASTKAFAELLEWHSLTVYENKNFITSSWNELKPRGAINPLCFNGFSKKQLNLLEYSNNRIDENSKFRWMKCFSLPDKKEYLLPAQLVYRNYERLPEEPIIRKSTSNGGAAGSSWEMAVEHAVCEAIERDALMIYWLNKIAPPKIDLLLLKKFGNDKINFLLDTYKKYNIDITLFDITTDVGVPVVLTAIRDLSSGRPSLFLAPKCDLDVEAAISASMIDGLRAGYWSNIDQERIDEINKKALPIENIEERRTYWCDKKRLNEIDFLFDGKLKNTIINDYRGACPEKKLKKIIEIIKKCRLDLYIADATTPIAKEFGLIIIMCLIPELYPLYLNEHFKYLGIKRLYDAPVKMGVREKPKKEEEMNLLPHPFL